jgi:hypothetical protein
LIEETEGIELAHCVGEKVDADSEGTQFPRRIEQIDRSSSLVQAQCGGQSPNARSNDRTVQVQVRHTHSTWWT